MSNKDGVNIWKITFFEGHYSYLAGDDVIDVVHKIPEQDWNEDYAWVTNVELVCENSTDNPLYKKIGKKPKKNL